MYFYEDMSPFFLIPLNKICPQCSTLLFLDVVHEKELKLGVHICEKEERWEIVYHKVAPAHVYLQGIFPSGGNTRGPPPGECLEQSPIWWARNFLNYTYGFKKHEIYWRYRVILKLYQYSNRAGPYKMIRTMLKLRVRNSKVNIMLTCKILFLWNIRYCRFKPKNTNVSERETTCRLPQEAFKYLYLSWMSHVNWGGGGGSYLYIYVKLVL